MNYVLMDVLEAEAPAPDDSNENTPLLATQDRLRRSLTDAGVHSTQSTQNRLTRQVADEQHCRAADLTTNLDVPPALAELLVEETRRTAARIFLLDNSGSTSAHDGKYLYKLGSTQAHTLHRGTRWEEICQLTMAQARWNVSLGTPCEFVLLNPLCVGDDTLEEGVDFVRVDAAMGDTEAQIQALQQLLNSTGPRGVTPLTDRLRKIRMRVAQEGRDLARAGQKVVLIIVTDGLPSGTQSGRSGPRERNEFVSELRQFGLQYPVHIVVRLCTEDDDVVDFYNKVDEELELQMEVIDDHVSEAKEIMAAGNGWFAYTPVLHRIREGGTFLKLLDLVDERRLNPMETSLLAQLLLREPGEAPFPSNTEDFIKVAEARIKATQEPSYVYDPITGYVGRPINASRLVKAMRHSGTSSNPFESFFEAFQCCSKR